MKNETFFLMGIVAFATILGIIIHFLLEGFSYEALFWGGSLLVAFVITVAVAGLSTRIKT